MTSQKARSLFYSVVVHATLVLLLLALGWWFDESVDKIVPPKRTMVLLSRVISSSALPTPNRVPPKIETPQKKNIIPPKLVRPKKVTPKPLEKKRIKPKKKRVIKKKVPLKKVPKKVPKKVEKRVVAPEPIKKVEKVRKPPKEGSELIVTPHIPVQLSSQAQKNIAAPATPKSTPEDLYVKAHISEIMSLLRKNLYYPRMARKRHMQGKVMVRFELLTDGSIRNITILEAKKKLLAKAAVTTIERLEGKFPIPSERLILHVPIMYQLH